MDNAPVKTASFTLDDHCLINAATEIAVARTHNASAMQDVLATFKDVLPHVSRENHMIGQLASAANDLIEHYRPKRSSAGLTAAQFEMAAALGHIHRWKHAASMAARQTKAEEKKR